MNPTRHFALMALGIGLAAAHTDNQAQAAPCAAGFLTGSAALLSDWSDDRPGLCRRLRPADIGQPGGATTQLLDDHSGATQRAAQGPAGVQGQPLPSRRRPAAPDQDGAERRHLRGREPRRPDPGPAPVRHPASSARARCSLPGSTCRSGSRSIRPAPIPTHVYVAESSRVVRYPLRARRSRSRSGDAEVVVPDLPQGAGDLPGQGHWTRDVVFSADGTTMYVSVGSYSNVQADGEDETERAAILEFGPDGSKRQGLSPGPAQPGLAQHLAGDRRALGHGQRARRARATISCPTT